jgi:two-component system, OmpR family, KDP operon response regulator KdpE
MLRVGNVLLADDNEKLQNLAKRAFEREGYVVRQALSGTELKRVLGEERPDVIVLDVALPDADGRDLLALLKKDPATATIPVIVWSGRDIESDRRIALELGAEDFVEKGPPSALVAKVERVLLRVRERL